MFLKYLEPVFKPWRAMRNRIVKVRSVKGKIKAEKSRVSRFGNIAKSNVNKARGVAGKAQGQAQKAQQGAQKLQGQAQGMQGQMPPPGPMGQMPPPGPMPSGQMPQGMQAMQNNPAGMPPAPGMMNPNPPIRTVGWFRKRKFCTQCENELDKSWDSCPYCAQNYQAAMAAAAVPAGPSKTQALVIDAAGGGSVQLLGWLVPIDGPQRGELFTLQPMSVIGTDPTCQIVLMDGYMSSKHAEIRAEGGTWLLKDLGSTNGTYVNDRRVDQHELVDNDFVKFGSSVVKFKSL
jgi:hypothetical protein